MEQWLIQLATNTPLLASVAIVVVLLLTGLGLPLPEDIPLVIAGYLAGSGMANPWMLFPACFVAIMLADALVFFLGRRYGHHVPRLPLLRRYLTEERLAKTERMLHEHGGKFIFVARFLPGLRTPSFFTAGSFKLPYWRFLLFDGTAAGLSVPAILLVAYFFADQIDHVRKLIQDGQFIAIGAVVLLVALLVFIEWRLKRRASRRAQPPEPPEPPEGPEGPPPEQGLGSPPISEHPFRALDTSPSEPSAPEGPAPQVPQASSSESPQSSPPEIPPRKSALEVRPG